MEDGDIPSAVPDSETTVRVGKKGDPLDDTKVKSNKIFRLPTGVLSKVEWIKKLKYESWPATREIHETPDMTLASFISTGKLAGNRYCTVYNNKRANVYNLDNTTVCTTKKPVLKGQRCRDGLCHIPLIPRQVETDGNSTTKEEV